VKPKSVADDEFADAVSKQRVAALPAELTPEIFETRLGNISPQTPVEVEIHYINTLKADLGGDGVPVTIPTSVAPRYGIPPRSYRQPPASSSAVVTSNSNLKIQVKVSAPVRIRKLVSRTHPYLLSLGLKAIQRKQSRLAISCPRLLNMSLIQGKL
jgi:Vault protein inter-alpha-trypsin domain